MNYIRQLQWRFVFNVYWKVITNLVLATCGVLVGAGVGRLSYEVGYSVGVGFGAGILILFFVLSLPSFAWHVSSIIDSDEENEERGPIMEYD